MKFHSTRDLSKSKYDSAIVIKQGLADDGGLFVPESIPTLTKDEIISYASLSYPELAAKILSKFLTDYDYDGLLKDCEDAYKIESFPDGHCPLRKVDSNTFSLELWHGPTCAFKDMALQLMPRLLSRSLVMTEEEAMALVLVATSGDTGKAALEGYKDVPQIKIAVFYPENGVSTVQKLQMTTQEGSNVRVCAVDGNFDDIQTAVKRTFSNPLIACELYTKGYFLSSANSINFGRLAPQIVYYVKSYCDLVRDGDISYGDEINVCVPTGNFGNILAAYIAKLMGLPIKHLICASNSNNILTDFLNTGRYDRNRQFYLTSSPSMDILISSNLERLLYLKAGAEKTCAWMSSLNTDGYYELDEKTFASISEDFKGYFADEELTRKTIKHYFEKYGYLMDPHTSVAFSALDQYRSKTDDNTPTVVASTASPYKFAKDVYLSLFEEAAPSDLDALLLLSNKTGSEIPSALSGLSDRKINFDGCVKPLEIYPELIQFIEE